MQTRSIKIASVQRSVTAIVGATALAALLSLAAGCSNGASQAGPPVFPPAPVTVARVVTKSVPLEVHAIGQAEAYSTVSVKPQVTAQLLGVHFREGEDVKKGDLLFTLDRRPFEAALQQAQAALARDKAQAANAKAQSGRYKQLFAQGITSKEQNDQFQAVADASDASVHADEAAVETTRLQLQYCSIYSPLDGRTGALMVHVGNIVKADDVPVLVVINQITPIYVDFSVPEQFLAEVKRYMSTGRLQASAILPDDPQRPEVGTLNFVDNAVDSTTGTIKLKGTFPNERRRLWPGQFVNAVVRLAEQQNAVVVPSQAVQTGQQGQYVFVVKSDMSAELRPVTVARNVGNDTVIAKGLQTGETVVTDGQLRIVPGAKVELKNAGAVPPTPAGASATGQARQ